MTLDINYWWVSVLALGVILLITWVVRRNRKDEKQFEKEIIDSDLKATIQRESKDSDTTP